jgi:Tol biopolymer transport system component
MVEIPDRLEAARLRAAGLALLLCAALGCSGPPREAPSTPHPVATSPEPLLSDVRQLTFVGRRAGEGYFGAEGRRMVFQSERDPDNPFFQIHLFDLETGDVRRISPGTGKTTCAWLHPDGQRALFASTHLDPDAQAKQARELEARASGRAKRYAWDFDAHYDLFAADLESGAPSESGALTRLTDARGYDAEGSWSPDGTRIVFASNRHAFSEELSPEDRRLFERDPASMMEIYTMRSDGSDVRRLTTARGYDGGPFFSPDGARIVWRRFSETGDTAEVYSMDRDGGDVRRLTSLGAMSWAPFYHPSGEYVIFATNLHGMDDFELYLVDAHGRGDPVRVTRTPGFDGLPAFSPDGRTLAWTSRRTPSGRSQIFVARWDHEAARDRLDVRMSRAGGDAAETTTGASGERARVPAPAAGRVAALRAHVEALTAEEMEGRRSGTAGEHRATTYVADAFAAMGLEPGGNDGTWYQPFDFTAGMSLGPGNQLRVASGDALPRAYAVDRAWRPLAFSRVGASGAAPVVFAGYGIVASAADGFPAYDSYGDVDVEGRWVLLLRYLPEDISPERRQHLARYGSLRHKAMTARDRGALGILVASGPTSLVKDPLVALRADASIGATSVLALSIGDDLAQDLLAGAGRSLAALQRGLDGGDARPAFEIPGLALEANVDLLQERRRGRSVLARLRAAGREGEAPVVIGAHVDHLGRAGGGDSLAREDERGRVHPGADDNASGVAALIEIARHLSEDVRSGARPLARDVIFAAWSGEEIGLLGSAAWARSLPSVQALVHGAAPGVSAYVNLDMVGRLRKRLVLQGAGSSPVWREEIERHAAVVGLPVAATDDSDLPTDTTSFSVKGVPVLSAFTGAHAEYHTPRDTPELLDYAGLARITRLLAAIGQSVAGRPEPLEFVVPERPARPAPRAGLRAYLGTIPSYGESERTGVTLSGVASGGPAETAGVRAGDRIVELAGRRIENIYDYTYAIDALKIGQPVTLVVMRDGERVALEVTPDSRE